MGPCVCLNGCCCVFSFIPAIFASLCWSDIQQERLNRYNFTLLIPSVVCAKSLTQLVMFVMGFMRKSQGSKLMKLTIRLQTFYNLPTPSGLIPINTPVVWSSLLLCAGKRSCSQVSWHVHTVHIFFIHYVKLKGICFRDEGCEFWHQSAFKWDINELHCHTDRQSIPFHFVHSAETLYELWLFFYLKICWPWKQIWYQNSLQKMRRLISGRHFPSSTKTGM